MGYSVHDEPDFARVYDDDESLTIRRGDLQALLDVATGSMDFGSGFLDNEQVEVMRAIAVLLGIDTARVTQQNFICQYEFAGQHQVSSDPNYSGYCPRCGNWDEAARAAALRRDYGIG